MSKAVPETRFRGCSQALLYNTRRPHQALGNRTPMAVWREEKIGALGDKAVDMTPRIAVRGLDNAPALPTCPQPQQQQELAA
jgi:putative transposase